jgi:hypothetical protein
MPLIIAPSDYAAGRATSPIRRLSCKHFRRTEEDIAISTRVGITSATYNISVVDTSILISNNKLTNMNKMKTV